MSRRLAAALVATMAVSVSMAGCASAEPNPGTSGPAEQPYVALISKGFRHQFWQAVKAGAEQAGTEFGVRVTFEGAQEEGNVEQQIQLLQTVLDKKPAAVGFAAIDSQAAGPLMQQAKNDNIPVIAFDSGVDSDVPVTHGLHRQPGGRRGSGQAHGRTSSATRARSQWSCTTRPVSPVCSAGTASSTT